LQFGVAFQMPSSLTTYIDPMMMMITLAEVEKNLSPPSAS